MTELMKIIQYPIGPVNITFIINSKEVLCLCKFSLLLSIYWYNPGTIYEESIVFIIVTTDLFCKIGTILVIF